MGSIKLKIKNGTVFSGTIMECAEMMKEDAEKERLACERGYYAPYYGYWEFEEFCRQNSIRCNWYPSTSLSPGFYALGKD